MPREAARGVPRRHRSRHVVACLCLVFAVMTSAQAHPHVWIDMKVKVLFDPGGRITALRYAWLFDEVYTGVVTGDVERDGSGKPTAAGLEKFAHASMQNLAKFHYLTKAESGGKPLAFGPPREPSARMVADRLELTFELPLDKPVEATHQAFTYSAYDPTYYIEMLHVKKKDAIELAGAPATCHFRLIEPKPDPAKLMEAAALDFTHGTDNGLGVFFAEKVVIQCDTSA